MAFQMIFVPIQSATQIILNNQKIRETPKSLKDKGMVGDTRFELVTSSMSTRRSTPELIALPCSREASYNHFPVIGKAKDQIYIHGRFRYSLLWSHIKKR